MQPETARAAARPEPARVQEERAPVAGPLAPEEQAEEQAEAQVQPEAQVARQVEALPNRNKAARSGSPLYRLKVVH